MSDALREYRPEIVARALLSLSERLRAALVEPLGFGEIDLDGRRRRARLALSSIEALADRRPISLDVWDAIGSYRAMLPKATDADLEAACRRERDACDAVLADALAFMERQRSLCGRPRPRAALQPLDTARAAEMADLLGVAPVERRETADLTMAGYDVVETDDGFDVVQAIGDRLTTLSTGHASESVAWAWLAKRCGDAVD